MKPMNRLFRWIRQFFPHKMDINVGMAHLFSPGCKVIVDDPVEGTRRYYRVTKVKVCVGRDAGATEIWARRVLW